MGGVTAAVAAIMGWFCCCCCCSGARGAAAVQACGLPTTAGALLCLTSQRTGAAAASMAWLLLSLGCFVFVCLGARVVLMGMESVGALERARVLEPQKRKFCNSNHALNAPCCRRWRECVREGRGCWRARAALERSQQNPRARCARVPAKRDPPLQPPSRRRATTWRPGGSISAPSRPRGVGVGPLAPARAECRSLDGERARLPLPLPALPTPPPAQSRNGSGRSRGWRCARVRHPSASGAGRAQGTRTAVEGRAEERGPRACCEGRRARLPSLQRAELT